MNQLPITSPQYLTDSEGKRISVVLPLSDYEYLLELLEELEDVRLYDEAKNRHEERVSLGDYLANRKARAHA